MSKYIELKCAYSDIHDDFFVGETYKAKVVDEHKMHVMGGDEKLGYKWTAYKSYGSVCIFGSKTQFEVIQ